MTGPPAPSEVAAPFLRSVDRVAADGHLLADQLDGWLDDLARIAERLRAQR